MTQSKGNDGMMTFGGHLEALRQTMFRILAVGGVAAVTVFCFKETTWQLLLAPSRWNFVTYRRAEWLIRLCGNDSFRLPEFHVKLITTDLSSQFMTHITTSVCLGLLVASPYILYELFRFVSPALLDSERKLSTKALAAVYALFIMGALASYFVVFPVSFRFLGTYQVSPEVESTITLDSYVSTFATMTLLMGVVFQLPAVSFVLGKMGLINRAMLKARRKHAFLALVTVAAIITPGQDIVSLALVSAPLYLLYEASIYVVGKANRHGTQGHPNGTPTLFSATEGNGKPDCQGK